jgi:hypothetical protein
MTFNLIYDIASYNKNRVWETADVQIFHQALELFGCFVCKHIDAYTESAYHLFKHVFCFCRFPAEAAPCRGKNVKHLVFGGMRGVRDVTHVKIFDTRRTRLLRSSRLAAYCKFILHASIKSRAPFRVAMIRWHVY